MTNQTPESVIAEAARKWIEQLDSDAHWARSPGAREKASSEKKILEGLLEAAAGAAPQAESDARCNCAYPEGHASYCPLRPVQPEPLLNASRRNEMRYTPMTEEVRGDYAHFQCPVGLPDCTDVFRVALAEFDRWLAALIREAKAEAWDEGVATALNHAKRQPDGITLKLETFGGDGWPNPYREGSET